MNEYFFSLNATNHKITAKDYKLHAHSGHPIANFFWYQVFEEKEDVAIASNAVIHLDFPIINIPKPFKK